MIIIEVLTKLDIALTFYSCKEFCYIVSGRSLRDFCAKTRASQCLRASTRYFGPVASKKISALRSRDASGLRVTTVRNCVFS